MGLSPEEKSALTLRANRARHDLADTLAALGHREHEVVEALPVEGSRRTAPLLAAAASAIGILAFGFYRAATAPQRRARERRIMLKRIWMHPEWTARKKSSSLGAVARPLFAALAGAVASQVVGYAARHLAENRARTLAPAAR